MITAHHIKMESVLCLTESNTEVIQLDFKYYSLYMSQTVNEYNFPSLKVVTNSQRIRDPVSTLENEIIECINKYLPLYVRHGEGLD